MSLTINQNITALNAWRNLGKTDRSMSSTMEKLASGLRINRAADDPSGLIISEQMRAQVVGLKAAVKNSEKGISMIQTAEGALDKVHALLDKMRSLALDSANSATSDENMLAANQAELNNILATITRISDNTTYGTKKLLNGDNANTATVHDDGGTGVSTADVSSVDGLSDGTYNLAVTVNTAGAATLTAAGTGVAYAAGETADTASVTLSEGDHTLDLTKTDKAVAAAVVVNQDGAAMTKHATADYTGTTDKTFTIEMVDDAKVVGTDAFDIRWSDDGGDSWTTVNVAGAYVAGTAITLAEGVKVAFAAGTTDTADSWTIDVTAESVTASLDGGASTTFYNDTWSSATLTSGLEGGGSANFDLSGITTGQATISSVKTTYDAALTEASTGTVGTAVTGFKPSDGEQTFVVGSGSMTVNMQNVSGAGTVQFANADNSLVFQIGANQDQTVKISIQDVAAEMLANNVTNASGFTSLGDISIDTAAKATDALALIDRAIDQVSVIRGDLGAFQANTLEANLESLRVASENLQASESVIRDTDMAAEMATFTKYQIMMQAGTAMLAQANQIPNNILQLLKG